MKYCITNGKIYQTDGTFVEGTLYVYGDKVCIPKEYEAYPGEGQVIDAGGGYVIPGLVDIHFHGCMGADTCDGTEASFHQLAAYELSQGVMAITPATMTISQEGLLRVCDAAREAVLAQERSWAEAEREADLLGLYMEGPFINPAKKGAQKEEHIRKPSFALFTELNERSGGLFKTVVVAPEMEGGMDFIEACQGKVRVSLAHMCADYDTAREAFEKGARQVTHLYNAMPGLTSRAPGPIGAAADREDVMAELICDGVHIHPSVVRATFKIFGAERMILISDSMRACGLTDGVYDLGGQDVTVQGNLATLRDGTIAGSVTNLMDCVRTAVKMGIPLGSAVRCASTNPAKAIGAIGYGSLTPGSVANVVILEEGLQIRGMLHRGKRVLG